ncbi:MAG: protein translocase subunit SecD [Phycisphaeraceae bacterium]|nr:MAG: protein translocase subunit SecD [Phycisphaeraceae bacterium]
MQRIIRNLIVLLVVFGLGAYFIYPPEEKLRQGKDLAGGASLVYTVDVGDDEDADVVVGKVIEAIKDRVDPQGVLEIAITAVGRDRIEITMPLPREEVKELRRSLEAAISEMGKFRVNRARLDLVFARSGPEREAELVSLSAGNAVLLQKLREAAGFHDEAARVRGLLAGVGEDAARRRELIDEERAASARYGAAVEELIENVVSPDTVRRVLALSSAVRRVRNDTTGQFEDDISQQALGIERLKGRYTLRVSEIDEVVGAYRAYAAKRRTLDDPQDLIRLLRGSGVLSFRIAVSPGEYPEEETLRRELAERGPGQANRPDARWLKVNQISNWYNNVSERNVVLGDPSKPEPHDPVARAVWRAEREAAVARFFGGRGLVGAQYLDGFYVLMWNTPDAKLTQESAVRWGVALAAPDRDEIGLPCIRFEMDTAGARLLADLTGRSVGKQMAVILDDEVYTAPTLQSEISKSGRITGRFSDEEIRYVVKVLSAGALAAKISTEPISTSVLAPQLGRDNLLKGVTSGYIAFGVCAGFLTIYYFACGLVATTALVANTFLLLALMAFNRAAFTLPGIAGVILTFAMAVDANVLIFERMREELLRGATLKEAVRLGYSRAMSAIVDGNLTNLIVCLVLGVFGTPEIRGFAITMSIGVVTTLFAQLFLTRWIFDVALTLGWKKTTMLPLAVPAVQRAFMLGIDWVSKRAVFYAFFAVLLAGAAVLCAIRGKEMFDTEFRGGTSVTVQLRNPESGERLKMTRAEVEKRIEAVAGEPGRDADLRTSTILVVNPDADGITSDTFTLKTLVTDQAEVAEVVVKALGEVIQREKPLAFAGSEQTDPARAPVFPITKNRLGDNIGKPEIAGTVTEYRGGVAVLLENLEPRPSLPDLMERIGRARNRPDMRGAMRATWDVLVIDGSEAEVRSAVVVGLDLDHPAPDSAATAGADDAPDDALVAWRLFVRDTEWSLIRSALTESSDVMSVQNFSPAIARTFAAQAIGSVLLSAILIIVYIWVRFGALRFSVSAIVPTLMDCVIAVGFIALAEVLYDEARGVALALGMVPFKIDLTVVASVLTVLGYSINDKIVILDRIRENRGKGRFATTKIVNDSINQCLSRTFLTGTTTILSTFVLYMVGGDALKPFAYSLGLGIIIGTLSSIMIAAPMVRKDPPASGR